MAVGLVVGAATVWVVAVGGIAAGVVAAALDGIVGLEAAMGVAAVGEGLGVPAVG